MATAKELLTNLADSIRAKSGATGSLSLAQMKTAVDGIRIGVDPSKAVRFYDYDGTLLYSYSHDEMISLTELPNLPYHEGLTAQGWNWTLEEILGGTADINVGVMYTTSDEATRLHITLQDNLRSTIPLYFYQTTSEGATINWGDGSSGETVSGTGYVETSHTYSAPGKYTISITPSRNCNIRLGKGANGSFVFGECNVDTRVIASYLEGVNIGARCSTLNSYTFQYCRNLKYITIPTSVTATGSYSFYYCDNLRSVTIPQRITSIGIYAFGYCRSLKTVSLPLKLASIGSSSFRYCYGLDNVTIPYNLTTIDGYCFSECHAIGKVHIPDSVTGIGNYAFNKCSSLAELTLPETLTSIGSYAFYQNYSLKEVNIPESVTSIGASAFYDCHCLKKIAVPAGVSAVNSATFYNCYGMKEYYFYPTSPPSLQSSSFNNIPSDCVIYVPQGSYDAYIADSAWETYGEYIAVMP